MQRHRPQTDAHTDTHTRVHTDPFMCTSTRIHTRTPAAQARAAHLSWWMTRLMASKSTAFLAFECCTFLDLGGSCALLRIVSRHSVRRPRAAGSSGQDTRPQHGRTMYTLKAQRLPECRHHMHMPHTPAHMPHVCTSHTTNWCKSHVNAHI